MKSWKLFGRKIRVKVVAAVFICVFAMLAWHEAAEAQEGSRGNVNVMLG